MHKYNTTQKGILSEKLLSQEFKDYATEFQAEIKASRLEYKPKRKKKEKPEYLN